MQANKSMTRRKFLRTTGVAAAGAAVLSAKSYVRAAGANDRINIGIIGLGVIGTDGHLPALLSIREADNIDITAVCDVYETRAKQYQEKLKAKGLAAKIYKDYQEMLADNDMNKVIIATPEHWHHKMILDALAAGKHVYSEKPLTHTISESQEIVEKLKNSDLKLQVGVQGMSDDSYSSAHEAIVAGKLGPVIEAQIDYVRNYPGMELGPWRVANLKTEKPDDLDWDMWQGPAPRKEWLAGRYFEWRCYRDYSGGIATDLFVHRLTRIIKACGLTFPERVVGMGGIYLWPDGRELPDNFELMAEYGKVKDVTPGMTVRVLGTMANAYGSDHCIRGKKATLKFTKEGWDIIDETSRKVVETHKKTGGEDQSLHHKNHHAAIRNGTPLNCPPELGLYGVVPVCMANESWFQRKMLAWDAKERKVVEA